MAFHLCSSRQVARLPVRNVSVSSADSQNDSRTSTSTPSTSKIKIFGSEILFAAPTQELEQKNSSSANPRTEPTQPRLPFVRSLRHFPLLFFSRILAFTPSGNVN